MGLFSSIGKIVGGVVKGAVGLATAPLKIAAGVAGGVVNSIFGGGEQQGGPCGPGPHGPSIFGCGPRPWGPPPPFMFGHHHHHHHRPGMFPPPPPGQGGIHFHFGA